MHWYQIHDFFVFNACSLMCKLFGHKKPAAWAGNFTFYFCPRCAKMFYWNNTGKNEAPSEEDGDASD